MKKTSAYACFSLSFAVATIFSLCFLGGQVFAQTAQEVPLPEYYGLYAVAGGKLLGIDVPSSTMTPNSVEVRVGIRNNAGNIINGSPGARTETVKVVELQADVKFLLFVRSSGNITPTTLAESLTLRAFPYVRNMSVDAFGLAGSHRTRRTDTVDGWHVGDDRGMMGIEMSPFAPSIQLLTKPVPGQSEMVLAAPAAPGNKLPPALYSISGGAGRGSSLRFAVEPLSEAKNETCMDVSYTISVGMMGDETVGKRDMAFCSDSSSTAGPAVSDRPTGGQPGGSQPAAPQPSIPVASTCGDVATCLRNGNSLLASGQYQQAATVWDRALQLGGSVSFAVCHELFSSCENGTFSLSRSEISFAYERSQKVFNAKPSDVRAVEARKFSFGNWAYFRLRVGNRNYNFDYIPQGMQCKVELHAECPNPGLQQQLTVGNWVIAAIPKLASGAFAQPPQPADVASHPVVAGGTIGQFRHGTLVTKLPSGSLVVSPTSQDATHTHPGVDIVADCGTPIYAMADGTVVDTVSSDQGPNFDSLGYMVIVKHSEGIEGKDTFSAFFHMNQPPTVQPNDKITAGQTQIGVVGKTGAASGCHLHLEIRHFVARFLVNPDWSKSPNIYGTGDLTKSTVFLNNWENPEQLGLKLQ